MTDEGEMSDEELEEVTGIPMPKSSSRETDEPNRDRLDPEETGQRFGEGIGTILWWPMAILGSMMWGLIGKLPARKRVYRWMIETGYNSMYTQTGAHLIVNTVYGDGEIVARAARVTEEGVETSNGEEWTLDGSVNYHRIGDAPIATGVADQHELVDPIAARVAEAVDLSPRRYRTVKTTPEGYEPTAWQDPMKAHGQSDGAVADGGMYDDAYVDASVIDATFQELDDGEMTLKEAAQTVQRYLSRVRERASGGVMQLNPSSTFDDIWVDASNPNPEKDGWIVSMDKAYDLHWDQAGSEEMRQQEIRGRLAERDPSGATREQLIKVLLFAGGVALGMFGPSLASTIAGGGEGVSSPLPMLVGVIL